MTGFTRVRLEPLGPFDFDGCGAGAEYRGVALPADTFFYALCVALADNGCEGELDGLLRRFIEPGRAPFRFTSLMPCAAGVYMLPYPLVAAPRTPAARGLRRRKRFKDIAWTSEAVFRSLVAGQAIGREMLEGGLPITVQGGRVWVTWAEREALKCFVERDAETGELQEATLWRTATGRQAKVARTGSASGVFGGAATHFNRAGRDWAGLYMVIEWLDADIYLQARLSEILFRLGETGIGGEPSMGYGRFAPHLEDLYDWNIGAKEGSYFTTLSPYRPRPEEAPALLPGSNYEITVRRGWLSSPGYTGLHRGTTRMLAEGSVLRWPDGDPKAMLGGLIEESGRRIYRCGLAFPIRVADAAMEKGDAGRSLEKCRPASSYSATSNGSAAPQKE